MNDIKKVEIFTDGACSGNPGPGGYGVVLRCGEHIKELSGGERETTNNRMELTGVIRGLEALKISVRGYSYNRQQICCRQRNQRLGLRLEKKGMDKI